MDEASSKDYLAALMNPGKLRYKLGDWQAALAYDGATDWAAETILAGKQRGESGDIGGGYHLTANCRNEASIVAAPTIGEPTIALGAPAGAIGAGIPGAATFSMATMNIPSAIDATGSQGSRLLKLAPREIRKAAHPSPAQRS